MVKILNKLFGILKIVLLIASFIMTLFILLNMYTALEKDLLGSNFKEFIFVFVPYVFLLIMFFLNIIFKHKFVRENLFYNTTCFIVLLAITFMCYRSIMDKNLILWYKSAYKVNFDYFSDQIFNIKAMLYGLAVTDLVLILESRFSKKKEILLDE